MDFLWTGFLNAGHTVWQHPELAKFSVVSKSSLDVKILFLILSRYYISVFIVIQRQFVNKDSIHCAN